MLPFRDLFPFRFVTFNGKSELMDPFRVSASTAALKLAGRSRLISPFTVLKLRDLGQLPSPRRATISPFTVDASAYPVVEIFMLPFTVRVETFPLSEVAL